jgi:small nuclear ribonucleoprotein (snRNP)-like protein
MYSAPDQRKLLEPPYPRYFWISQTIERIRVHLNQNNKMVIEGKIVGFDKFLNLVFQEAGGIYLKNGSQILLGTTLLQGECTGIVHAVPHTYD